MGALLALGLAGLACVVWPGGGRAQDDDACREDRSNSSIRMCFAPAPIRAICPSPTRRARASRTRSPNFSRSKLGKSVAYTFYPGATGFIRNTLNAHRCDVVLGIAQGDDIVQPTNPYYRTSYVAAYRKGGPLEGLDSLSDPRLKTAKIGIVAGTPPATYLADERAARPHQVLRARSSTRASIRRPTR